MTPAVDLARAEKIEHRIHEYPHDPGAQNYGEEASEKLGVSPDRVFKTLVVRLDDNRFAVAVIPVAGTLNLKRFARACGARKAAMAETADAERVTGYLVGGISPLGQKRALITVIDAGASDFPTIFVSAGRRGLEIELAPDDLRGLTHAQFEDIAAR